MKILNYLSIGKCLLNLVFNSIKFNFQNDSIMHSSKSILKRFFKYFLLNLASWLNLIRFFTR